MSEVMLIAPYFMYVSFIELPFNWKPRRAPYVVLADKHFHPGHFRIGERTLNPFAYLYHSKYLRR